MCVGLYGRHITHHDNVARLLFHRYFNDRILIYTFYLVEYLIFSSSMEPTTFSPLFQQSNINIYFLFGRISIFSSFIELFFLHTYITTPIEYQLTRQASVWPIHILFKSLFFIDMFLFQDIFSEINILYYTTNKCWKNSTLRYCLYALLLQFIYKPEFLEFLSKRFIGHFRPLRWKPFNSQDKLWVTKTVMFYNNNNKNNKIPEKVFITDRHYLTSQQTCICKSIMYAGNAALELFSHSVHEGIYLFRSSNMKRSLWNSVPENEKLDSR